MVIHWTCHFNDIKTFTAGRAWDTRTTSKFIRADTERVVVSALSSRRWGLIAVLNGSCSVGRVVVRFHSWNFSWMLKFCVFWQLCTHCISFLPRDLSEGNHKKMSKPGLWYISWDICSIHGYIFSYPGPRCFLSPRKEKIKREKEAARENLW